MEAQSILFTITPSDTFSKFIPSVPEILGSSGLEVLVSKKENTFTRRQSKGVPQNLTITWSFGGPHSGDWAPHSFIIKQKVINVNVFMGLIYLYLLA